MDRWLQSFRAELAATDLLRSGRRLLVAVSGGPDSVCLLQLIHELSREAQEPLQLLVGHVHHGIRGAEADRDAEFVERLARERGLEFICERGDAPALSRTEGTSLEAAARLLRYRAFGRWARDRELDGIALGHHSDDQAETVLLRGIRGSGLRGLGGIPPRRALLDVDPAARPVVIVRPLLRWRREKILDFLAARGLEVREDSSNADRSIPRNRVRAEILPALEEVQPGAAASLVRLGEFARRTHEDLRRLGERAFREARVDSGVDWVSFDADALASWPASVLYEVIASACRRVERSGALEGDEPTIAASCRGGYEGALSRRPFERLTREIEEWTRGGQRGGRVIQLGAGVEAELRYGRLRVHLRGARDDSASAARVLLELPPREVTAAACWQGWEFRFSWRHRRRGRASREAWERRPGGGTWTEWFDLDVLERAGSLHVRARREGDVFHPLGAPGRKKIKEFFRECEVEPRRRQRVPLLVSGETIQWVVGCRIGQLARCRPETRRILSVRASRD